MKKHPQVGRKTDIARHRAQSKPALAADQTKARTPIRDEAVCYGADGEDLRKDNEGFYVSEQLKDSPRRRVTREQALQWFLDQGFVPDEFQEDFRSIADPKARFDWKLVLDLEEEVRATKALLGLCFAQLTMDPDNSMFDASLSPGTYAAGIQTLIDDRARGLTTAYDAVTREVQGLRRTERSAI